MNKMPNWLKQRAYLTPDRIAMMTEERTVTFRELHKLTERMVFTYHQHGVRKGQHAAILMKNSIEMAAAIHALTYIGATAVLLNTRLTASELEWQLRDSEASFLICDEALNQEWETPSWTTIGTEELVTAGTAHVQYEHYFHLDQTATIMYTSGTTGKPKGVLQSYGNHYWSAAGSSLNLGLHHDDRWLCAVPLFHISGLSILMRGVIYGMTVILHDSFHPSRANRAIIENGATIVSVVQTMLSQMIENLEDSEYPETFRCMLLGGGPAPMSLLKECEMKKIPVYQTYGMTETSSQIVTLSPEYSLTKLGSAGKPLFPCEIKIMENDLACPPFTEGEIHVQGPNVTKGYWKRKAEIHNGWLQTGDMGFLDEEGFLYVLDRRSDLIVSGGENIYPAEIEAALLSHPSVIEAGVTGMSDAKWGQVPHAFIAANDAVSEEELISYCSAILAKYKIPKRIHFLSKLPRNASNKLVRRKLTEALGGPHD
ncbi:o-succinylbenzoate--CoA ligase [Bacillus sp. V2I10]|uniref:o-succinylbenzoate--CoA ligase n=1 Tax=Bacillus sp. V2I10 TaxID=3042276 RepID=UPI00277F8F66|nr:o-succinylbenzoate--CoA ligase [Bacillus sp. V2I10]MDQ0857918.1 O-succinylbenzoic acid--CoA ligase [Bacillus sp. V2I10]